MRTVLFVYYLKSEGYSAMLKEKEQGFDFVHSYKMKTNKNTVVDIA